MSQKKSFIKTAIAKPQFSSLVILIVFLVTVMILQESFFTVGNWTRSLNTFVPPILLAMGQGIVMIVGGLDLSNGNAMSLMSCLMAKVMLTDSPMSGVYALLIGIATAIVVGVVNGLGVGYLRLPPVIVTFATSYMWLGLALFVMPTPGGQAAAWFTNFYKFGTAAKSSGLSFSKVQTVTFGDVIPPVLILLLIGCLVWYFISRTHTGRYIYAVGGNDDSAFASGINTAWVQMKAYIINSFLVLLVALFYVGQNQAGDARMGSPMTLISVAAAVIGGIAMSGGRGNVYFAIVGSLILSLVNKVIFFSNLQNELQTLVNGVIIIVAISLSTIYTIIGERTALKGGK